MLSLCVQLIQEAIVECLLSLWLDYLTEVVV